MPQTLQLDLPDGKLLRQLYGDYDKHLHRIEQAFKIQAAARGGKVCLSGDESHVSQASTVLTHLYNLLEKGVTIGMIDVDTAIRLVLAEQNNEAVPMTQSLKEEWAAKERITLKTKKKNISPCSKSQQNYIQLLEEKELVFGIGPAGTGKTFLAVAMAVSMLLAHKVEKIILSRPALEAGEKIGFLAGDMKEKVDPYLRPIYDALHEMLSPELLQKYMENGVIEIAPLAFMRGRTLSHAYVILDEAQNTTPVQMKMFLTRLGEGSRMVITGDPTQIDLPSSVPSGLKDAIDRLESIKEIGFAYFTEQDVMRHHLTMKIVQAYK